MKSKDKGWHGFIPGMIGPLFGALVYYFLQLNDLSFAEFLDIAKKPAVLSPLLSFGAVMNLIIFFLFIQFNRYHAARGVIFATILYGAAIIILKVF